MDNPFQPPSDENTHRPQSILDRIERTLLYVGLTLFFATGGTAIVYIVFQSELAEGVLAVLLPSTIVTGLCRGFVLRVLD